MKTKLDSKRIWLFLLFAFGIAWTMELVIYLKGGLTSLSVGSLAWLLLLVSMAAPALAHLLTRWITREGWKDLFLRPLFRSGKRFWLVAWLITPIFLFLGLLVYFLLFPQYFDSSLSIASNLLAQTAQKTGKAIPLTPSLFIIVQAIQGILLAPIINSLAVLGEEFGWRAYLLPKLMPLGGRNAMLIIGAIWGLWHWPIIFMGYEYGLSYPGAPWLGAIIFLWFTFIIGTYLGWLTLKTKNVWPAVIAHGSINGIAAIALLFVKGHPDPLFGPAVVGLVASLPFAFLAIWLLARSDVFSRTGAAAVQPESLLAHSGLD